MLERRLVQLVTIRPDDEDFAVAKFDGADVVLVPVLKRTSCLLNTPTTALTLKHSVVCVTPSSRPVLNAS